MIARSPTRCTAPLPDLNRLRAFVVVAEELNYHNAAARLNMTQSPLSRVIKKLEDEVGVPLFQRSRRRVTLTPAGQRLLPEARELLDSAEQLLSGLRSLSTAGNELVQRRADRDRREASGAIRTTKIR